MLKKVCEAARLAMKTYVWQVLAGGGQHLGAEKGVEWNSQLLYRMA